MQSTDERKDDVSHEPLNPPDLRVLIESGSDQIHIRDGNESRRDHSRLFDRQPQRVDDRLDLHDEDMHDLQTHHFTVIAHGPDHDHDGHDLSDVHLHHGSRSEYSTEKHGDGDDSNALSVEDGSMEQDLIGNERIGIPIRQIAFAVCLFVMGIVCLIAGGVTWAHGEQSSLPLFVVGGLSFTPGAYYSFQALQAWRGVRGYRFDSIFPSYQ